MYFCAIAKVVDVTLDGVLIESDGDQFTIQVDPDELKEIEIGRNYCFAGESRGGRMRAERVILRRFLDPLFEQDVLTASGEFAIIKPVTDPFPEAFQRLMERDLAKDSAFPTMLEEKESVQETGEQTASPDELDLDYTGDLCSVCNSPQYSTPSGVTCANGHGGAPSKD